MKIVFATNNKHKLLEVQHILPKVYALFSLEDIGFTSDIEETGTTLEDNSDIKAQTVYNWLKDNKITEYNAVFADDTGLEVDALGGKPGVYSARYAGEPANDKNNRQKLLHELKGIKDRQARFRTVVTLIINGKTYQTEGRVEGKIDTEEHGTEGFGYDSLFIPENYNCPFACLKSEEKNRISHRAKAIENLVKLLENTDIK